VQVRAFAAAAGAASPIADLVLVAATVVAESGMQRLVDVADEMDEELQRVATLGQRRARIGEDRRAGNSGNASVG
jgi:hypothetical protein